MSKIKELEGKSIFIIREVYNRLRNPALLWSMGKDSTVLLWLCRKAFYNEIPFPVLHIDTGFKFKEIYEFREKYTKKWNFDLRIIHDAHTTTSPNSNKFACCNVRKTESLKQFVHDNDFKALIVGIRRDEHGIRNKERYFSPRDKEFKWNLVKPKDVKNEGDSPFVALQDAEMAGWNIFATDFGDETDHVRIHPLLHWTELDIWEYIQQEKIPFINLYLAKNGKRYRSIGCEPCCKPIESKADTVEKIIEELKTSHILERSGRDQDKEDEYNMQRLRSLGYM